VRVSASLAGRLHPEDGKLMVMDLITMATSTQIAETGARVAVLPVGSFEQHGAYLPLATDTIVACAIAGALEDAYPLQLLPPITISCSHEHAGWPGTVSISAATLITVIADIRGSLRRAGLDNLVLVNGHGGNYVLRNIVQEASVDGPSMALFPGHEDWSRARADAGLVTTAHDDMHGGELETSILLYTSPQVVRDGNDTADCDAPHRPHLLTLGMRGYTESGVVGRPSFGTAAKGKAIIESLVESFNDHFQLLGRR
jgi:creatinine amidohydrolase